MILKSFRHIVFILYGLLVVSCMKWGNKENYRLIWQAQQLLELTPDSVLTLLNLVNTALFNEAEKSEYALLRIQAKSNAGRSLQFDTEIFQAREYFIREKDWEKAALACFYAGIVIDDRDDIALETGYYREALAFAKKTNNLLLQGKILYIMGYMQFDKLWYTDALTQYQQAIKMFQFATEHHQQEVYQLIAIGNSFVVEHNTDSAQHYFDKALLQANDTTMQEIVYHNMMKAYRELGQLNAAAYFGRKALNIATDKADIYQDLAQLFLDKNIPDSARYYMVMAEPSIGRLNDLYGLANFYNLYYQIEKNTGNDHQALGYFELYSKYRIELTNWNEMQKKMEVQKRLDDADKEIEYNRVKSRWWKITGVLCGISLALLMAFLTAQKKNIRQMKELVNAHQEKEKTEHQLNIYQKHDNEMKIAFLEKLGVIKDIALLNTKKTSMAELNAEIRAIGSMFTMQKFIGITNELYPGFTGHLNYSFPDAGLSEKETGVCCLMACGFTNKELALFIYQKKDTQAIEKLKNRIRKKIGIPARGNIQDFLLERYRTCQK